MKYYLFLFGIFILSLLFSCHSTFEQGTFGYDLNFIQTNYNPIILKDGGRQVIVSPEFQGRIFTSTTNGMDSKSLGWFNKNILSSDSALVNRSKVGGAGRIWFGPDQGPNTLFFDYDPKNGVQIHASPKDLDTLSFNVLSHSETSILLGQQLHLENLKETNFYIDLKREISLISENEIKQNLKIHIGEAVNYVAYEAKTTMKNIGDTDWSKDKGLISLWELGCMSPTDKTTAIIPLKKNVDTANVYFTDLDSSRLVMKDQILFYKADANYLNKIGVPPQHAKSIFGSYSPESNLLTIIKYSLGEEVDYVNSHPEHIDNQYAGDVINIFNDGKWGDIGPFGPFYELETSSPAIALKRSESLTHIHQTYHFEGSEQSLNLLAKSLFGINLDKVNSVFN